MWGGGIPGLIAPSVLAAPPTLHQSVACNRLQIGCILSEDFYQSSVAHVIHVISCEGPGVKQADLSYTNKSSITVRPRQDEEEDWLPAGSVNGN